MSPIFNKTILIGIFIIYYIPTFQLFVILQISLSIKYQNLRKNKMLCKNRKVLRVHYLPTDLKPRIDVDLQANPTSSLEPLILDRISQKIASVS